MRLVYLQSSDEFANLILLQCSLLRTHVLECVTYAIDLKIIMLCQHSKLQSRVGCDMWVCGLSVRIWSCLNLAQFKKTLPSALAFIVSVTKDDVIIVFLLSVTSSDYSKHRYQCLLCT